MEEMNKKAPAKEKKSVFSRIAHFFRSYKSEAKKIVWCPWKQVRKSSLVVLVIVVAFAAIICALDFGFSWGLKNLRGFVNPSSIVIENNTSDDTTEDEKTESDDASADDADAEGEESTNE